MNMIPYTLERRSDTGVSNTTLGVWLFLASEVMLFGALFSSYTLLRVSAVAWPSGRVMLSLWFGGVNTVLLSVVTMLAWRGRSRARPAAKRLLATSSILALLFLVNKGFEYRGEIARGFLPSVSTFAAMYFTLTGFHALHVIGGLVANAWALAGRAGDAMTANRIRLLALYWTFVDIIWVIIFVLVYVS